MRSEAVMHKALVRDFFAVMRALEALLPDLAPLLARIRTGAVYHPPEFVHEDWARAAVLLSAKVPPEHPNFIQVIELFAGVAHAPEPNLLPEMTNEA
jgi:hypothetical protein